MRYGSKLYIWLDKLEDMFLESKLISGTKIEDLYFDICRMWKSSVDLMYYKPINFLTNVRLYKSFLWNNAWYDHYFIFDMLKLKLKIDSKMYKERGMALESENLAKEMEYCVGILERICEDDYDSICSNDIPLDDIINGVRNDKNKDKFLECMKQAEEARNNDIKKLFEYMSKYILKWWD